MQNEICSSGEEDDDTFSSVLGTKEFWDSHYRQELDCFADANETHQQVDIGSECWFDNRIMRTVARYLSENFQDGKQTSLIDIGCGNGAFLRHLADLGFSNLTGVDYSETGVELARRSAAVNDVWSKAIRSVECVDLCSPRDDLGSFGIGVDIGTYDAITLRPPDEADVESHRQKVRTFINNVTTFVRDRLVIASCNWTVAELQQAWASENKWKFSVELPTPSFRFGNKEGNTVTCAVFEKTQK